MPTMTTKVYSTHPDSYDPMPHHLEIMTMGNPKILKGLKKSWFPITLMLSPASFSGYQVCPARSPGCERACLNTAGAGGGFGTTERAQKLSIVVQMARVRRTVMLFEKPDQFFDSLITDIKKSMFYASHHSFHGEYVRSGKRKTPIFRRTGSMKVCCRLNCTSDIQWENYIVPGTEQNLMELFPSVQFYDYTKIPKRYHLPSNYHLTFSRHELPRSKKNSEDYYAHGVNTAVVFSTGVKRRLPEQWHGDTVIDGRLSDLRFLDPPNVVVGLSALGKGEEDTTGFVVQVGKGSKPGPQKNFEFMDLEDGGDLFPDLAL